MNKNILKEMINKKWIKVLFLIPIFLLGNSLKAQTSSCLSFNGNSYIKIANTNVDSIDINNFTFEAKISGSNVQPTGHDIIFSNRSSSTNGIMFLLHSLWGSSLYKMLCVQLEGVNYFFIDNGAFNGDILDGNCHHVAASKSGNTLSMYIDGTLIGTHNITNTTSSFNGSTTLKIGQDIVNNSYFTGNISQVRIWDTSRTQSDIVQNSNISIAGTTPNLVHYWELNDGNGQTVLDKTLNNNGVLGETIAVQSSDPLWGANCCSTPPGPPGPPGASTCSSPSNQAVLNILPTSVVLDWDTGLVSGTQWYVEYGPSGFTQGTGTIVSVMTFDSLFLTGLTALTQYDWYVLADCGSDSSAWIGPDTFTTLPDYCGGTHFYDNGGATGNYTPVAVANPEITTIFPDMPGDVVTATFSSFAVEEGWDGLMIYDGPNTSSPLISSGSAFNRASCPNGAYTGSSIFAPSAPITSTHTSGALTFVFIADGGVDSGWDATISCVTSPPTPPGPPTGNVCSYTLTLNDSYGDGWNGNSLNMYVNGSFVSNYTFTSGNSQSFTISYNDGDSLSFIWDDSGLYDNECSWNLANSIGNLVLNEASLLSTTPVGPYVVNCSNLDANFTYTQGNQLSCNSIEHFLVAQAFGGTTPYTYTWSYNGTSYSGQTQTIEIFDFNSNVELLVTDSTGDSLVLYDTIIVIPSQMSLSSNIISQTCDSTIIQFFGTSNIQTTSWQWNVGSYSSTMQNPIFSFANDGSTVDVALTTVNGFCNDTAISTLLLDTSSCGPPTPPGPPTGNSCSYTLTLNDSYGDGWNGNSLNMYVNGSFVSNYTFTSGNSQSFTISYNDGDSLSFIWDDSGLYDNECSWNLANSIGNLVLNEASLLSTTPVGPYVVNCSNLDANFTYTQGNQLSCNSIEHFLVAQAFGGIAPYNYTWTYNGTSYSGQTQTIEIFDFNSIVELMVTDSTGDSIVLYDTIVVTLSQMNISSNIISQTCDSTIIQFYGTSNMQLTSWQWSVGSYSSTMQSPIFSFANDGSTVDVALTTVNGFCNDTAISILLLDTNNCGPPTDCGHILTLEDSYGDGWNGNSLNAYVNGVFFNNYTFTFGNTQTFPISLNTGDQISFVWDDSGNWSNECSWSFANASGNVVLNQLSPLSTNNIGPYTAFCNDFSSIITSTLDSMFSCTSSSYQFTATPNGGTAPYTYVWIYDGNTYTDEFPIIITNISSPTISVTITDANGLISNETYLVTAVEPLSLYVSSSTPTCDSSNYLYAYANPSGGSGSYSYLWSNGATTSSINSSTGGITLGSYNVIVTDNVTGCTVSSTVNLYDACYSISGTVYVDYNGNCIVDGADHPLSNSYYVDLTGAGTSWGDWDYVQTSDNGHYFIEDVSVGSYGLDVNGYNVNSYTQACPNASFTVTVDATNPNPSVDIFMTPPAPFQDLSVSLYSITTFTPGFPYWAYGSYCNDGTIPMSGSVVLSYDADLTYITGSSNPDVVDATNNILTWNFTNLQPGQCVSLSPDFTTSTTAVLGSTMSNNIVVNPIAGDVTPTNNTAYVIDTVVGSWDPNDKSVYPFGNITPDQKDHSYHINFQNEGNGPATLVVVRDDLDDNLDIQTLRNVSASHNFVLTIENTDELVFTFNNIYLTPKDDDEPNSKGHIDFTISQKEDLPLGTTIENTAEIFFDFNEAIVTNTVVNTIVEKSTGIETLNALEAIDVYPNPSNGLFNVALENDNSLQSIAVYDVLGKLIFSANDLSGSKAIINLQNTSNGMYIIKVSTEKGTASKRLVLSK